MTIAEQLHKEEYEQAMTEIEQSRQEGFDKDWQEEFDKGFKEGLEKVLHPVAACEQ